MKKLLLPIIKRFNWLYNLYYYMFSFGINLLKLFIKTDEKLILVNSFGGKKYDDSPRALYEAMLSDKRFEEYEFVWAFYDPEKFDVPGCKIIKIDTFTYFKTALKARCWITNSGIERGLNFKGKNTFYFNTWHGTPIKKMGTDIAKDNQSFRSKSQWNVDMMTAQSEFEIEIFSKSFDITKEKFLKCGLPRNDVLVHYTDEQRRSIREKLGLSEDKKVILYAPTFREYERDAMQNCVLIPPINLDKWEKELKEEFCLLFRAHYEVGKVMNIVDNSFVKNMTVYSDLSELMIVADILISDYSSIFFDFSVMDKVMLHLAYDYDTYSSKRGMYFDIRDEINGANNEDDLIEILRNMDWEKEETANKQFRNKYLNYYGNAVEKSLDCIIKNIGE